MFASVNFEHPLKQNESREVRIFGSSIFSSDVQFEKQNDPSDFIATGNLMEIKEVHHEK
jgi:hypothetical protein